MVALWISAALAVGMLAVAVARHRRRRKREIATHLRIDTPNAIDEGLFVKLGEIEQWVRIRGEDRGNPVLLVMHGGPATSYMAFAPLFRSWERHFTVVQWDRRGVGKTFGCNGRAGCDEMSLERIAADGAELCEFLIRHLHKTKIILLGQSMGSMVGISIAALRPDLLHAYVGTEQIIDMARNETVSYQLILERVRAIGDVKSAKALEHIGRPPYANPRAWGTKQRAAGAADGAYGSLGRRVRGLILYSPEYSPKDVLDLVRGAIFCLSKLYSQWMSFNAHRLGTHFNTALFIIQGENDVMTPTELARDWLATIEAPHKSFSAISGGGHMVMVTAADAYLHELIQRVRPLAMP